MKEEKIIEKETQEYWYPVIIKEQSVIKNSEGLAWTGQRDYYNYTTITDEKVILYNRNTWEMKKFEDK